MTPASTDTSSHWFIAPRRLVGAALALVCGLSAAACPSDDDDDDGDPDSIADAEDAAGDDADAGDEADADLGERPDVEVEEVATGLENPWGLAFLSEDEALVTERPGRLSRLDLDTGELTEISGAPDVATENQGGLLDVALHPDFDQEPWVYLTYAAERAGGGGAATHLGRGWLEGDALEDFDILHAAPAAGISGGRHFGSRIIFDDEGYLYYTVGDRGSRDLAQETENAVGTTLRLEDDGSIPEDNPFANEDGFEPAIFTYGHRNVQGMTLHPDTGAIWQSEHGPSGGDEINRLQEGQNFGWPIATYGVEYGPPEEIGDEPHERDDVVDPLYHWQAQDSFAPAGAAFYDGAAFPAWRGDLFVGGLNAEELVRFSVDGDEVEHAGGLLGDLLDGDQSWRVRDVVAGPDDLLYLVVDASDAPVARLAPAAQ